MQKFFFAVSQSADPLGTWFIYQVDVGDPNFVGGFWDFPQLGRDRNALIFTANFFDSADNFIDARMFTVAKDAVYSGPGGQPPPPSCSPAWRSPWRHRWVLDATQFLSGVSRFLR